MYSFSREQNYSNSGSDFKIFSLKDKKFILDSKLNMKNKNSSKQYFINAYNEINEKKEENKLPFTNLILRERINTDRQNNNIIPNKKSYIHRNNKQNNIEEFLNIYKLLTDSSKKANKKPNAYKIKSFENKDNVNMNLNIHNKEKKYNNNYSYIKRNNKKVSKGLQTSLNFSPNKIETDYQKKESLLNPSKNNDECEVNHISPDQDIKNNNKTKFLKMNFNNINSFNEKIFKNKIKEDKNEEKVEEEITDYMNNINLPQFLENNKNINKKNNLNRRNTPKVMNLSDLYVLPKNNYFINKTQHLIRNNNNIIDFYNVKIEENKDFLSVRELYRNMILLQKNKLKKKHIKSILKNKKIREYLNKDKLIKENKKSSNNLVSLENYTQEKFKNRHTNKQLKIRKNKTIVLNEEMKLLNRKKFLGSVGKKPNYENDNFFTNILKSFSRSSERVNKTKIKKKINSNFRINIQTMLELNNKSN